VARSHSWQLWVELVINRSVLDFVKGGYFSEAGESREFYEQGSVFLVCKPKGWIVNIMLLKIPLNCFLSDRLLSLHIVLFLLVWM
jgi:hypothetical protein